MTMLNDAVTPKKRREETARISGRWLKIAARWRGGGIRNELIELATAFYSLVDAGRGEGRDGGREGEEEGRGVSHRAVDDGATARAGDKQGGGEVLSWLRAPLTDSVRVAFSDRRRVASVP